MSGFLDDMARSSAARVAEALRHESSQDLERRARAAPRAAPLRLSASGFDVIAELKLRSPAAGVLGEAGDDWLGRITSYARSGATAVSVLTEPTRFDGTLEHLRLAAAALQPLGVPAMRKDFVVDPYQVLEARAVGAGGVLVILRMLERARIEELLAAAAEHELFVLLEAFDEEDLELAQELTQAQLTRSRTASAPLLIGVNCRDLQTLQVRPERFAALAPFLPQGSPAVAESGVAAAADARRMQDLGYRVALIGTALMSAPSPPQLLADIFAATRTVKR